MKGIVRFYAELNDLIPHSGRHADQDWDLPDQSTVGELLESFGVPTDSVDLVLVNGESSPHDYRLQEGDRVSVYPMFERLNIETIAQLEKPSLRNLKFLCAPELGVLNQRLNAIGYDSCQWPESSDLTTVFRAGEEEKRILVARDKALLRCSGMTRQLFLAESDPETQLAYLIETLDLPPPP